MKKLLPMLFLALASLLAQAQTAVAPAGSGTSTDPYQIATLDNLYWLAMDTTNAYKSYLIQTADIDASDTKTWGFKSSTVSGFCPIGYLFKSFKGHYNGKGHTISNLYINSTTGGIGLFNYVLGTIDSLHIVNAYIYGRSYTGALAGYVSGGKITNCSSSGFVSSDTTSTNSIYIGGLIGGVDSGQDISYCSSSATVLGYDCVGGLIGRNQNCIINYCYSTGSVTGHVRVGGLVGNQRQSSLIENSYSTGKVNGYTDVGGFIGTSSSSKYPVINCYSKGDVVGHDAVGGFVGKLVNVATNCHSTGNVTAYKSVGGFVGESNDTITYCYSTGDVTGNVVSNIANRSQCKYVGGFCGYSYLASPIYESYSTGNVSGYNYVGGFTGFNSSCTMSNCYSTGNVTSVNLANAKYIGGFVGFNLQTINSYTIGKTTNLQSTTYAGTFAGGNSYRLQNSYWNSQTTSQTKAIGADSSTIKQVVTSLTSTQMKRAENFNAWNFDTIWAIRTDSTYPLLRKVNNAPIALPDTLKGSAIKLSGLLANDFDYETLQTKLTYKIISHSNQYGTNTDSTFTFNSGVSVGATDSVTYRVGELIAAGDTLWGNQTTAKLVYVADVATTVANATPAAALSLSPNPATDAFTVTGLAGSASILVTDVSGKTLISKTINQGKTITISSLPTGVYLVKINTPNGVVQKKLIKK